MKIFKYLLLTIVLVSCNTDPQNYIPHLNGYWEIASVTLPNGTKRNYTINQTVDFISVNNLNGYRKKMKPNFSGTFETSNDKENFTVKIENNILNLYYKTPYSEWKETVLKASQSELKISNADKVIYLYKRYKPIKID